MHPTSLLLSVCIGLSALSEAATRIYDFNITRLEANPDNAFKRSVIGINGQWPIPTIMADVGDTVIVNVLNQLGDEDTSLHFHGLYQNGTNEMDGVAAVTQCPIGPGSSFTYKFEVNQPGTYWYHSHNKGQYPDGLRGPLIVNDPQSPFKKDYDEEIILTLSDWYHESVPLLLNKFMSRFNPTGAEPVPQAALMNDRQNLDVKIEPGKTYLIRAINMGAFAAQYLWFEDHTMRVVEVDGIYHEPKEAKMLYISAAQRYGFLLTTKNTTQQNHAFVSAMDTSLFDKVPDGLESNVTGWLVYDEKKERLKPALVDEFDPLDDFTLVPHDKERVLSQIDQSITLNVKMDNLDDGANYAFFNDISYRAPVVPTLYTALTSGSLASNASVYGPYTNSIVLSKGEVVEVIINNMDKGKHPFHLHGHAFQLVYRSEEAAGSYIPGPSSSSSSATTDPAATPMRRDTVLVHPNGHAILRFRADNPGVWLFHCHIEWHVSSGLMMTFVEAPHSLQRAYSKPDGSLTLPADHLQACRERGIATAGNPVGNTNDFFDFEGIPKPPDPLPAGFTTKGYVALVCSVLSAFLGMATVVWYGSSEIVKK